MSAFKFIALVSILVASVSVTGAVKAVVISIEESVVPKPYSHEFAVEGDDDDTLEDLLNKAQSDEKMTYQSDDVNGVYSVDGVFAIWVITGEGFTDVPQPDQLNVIPANGAKITFSVSKIIQEGASEDPTSIPKVVKMNVSPIPALLSHFPVSASGSSTLLDMMTIAQRSNVPAMTYKFEYGLFLTTIDGKEAEDDYEWAVYGDTDGKGWTPIFDPINLYIPSDQESILFILMKEMPEYSESVLDEHQKYNAGSRMWYSYMIIVTAAVLSVYIA